jgi:hypothetical protein
MAELALDPIAAGESGLKTLRVIGQGSLRFNVQPEKSNTVPECRPFLIGRSLASAW